MSRSVTFESGHTDMIHDAVMDYYGRRLATASSDRSIRIFDVTKINPSLSQSSQSVSSSATISNQQSNTQHTLSATWIAHDAPIWSLSWAHPKFGSIISSCSYDGRICIWKEVIQQSIVPQQNQQYSHYGQQSQHQPQYQQQSNWIKIHEDIKSEVSINHIEFAPHSYGLVLAAACADGNVLILTRIPDNNQWERSEFFAHKGGVNSLSWSPDMSSSNVIRDPLSSAAVTTNPSASQISNSEQIRRIVTGGCDSFVRIFNFSHQSGQWMEFDRNDCLSPNNQQSQQHNVHSDWIRDVAWSPYSGIAHTLIASASEDQTVNIYSESPSTQQWNVIKTLKFHSAVYRVSWSIMGNILAISLSDGKVELFKEANQNDWKQISTVNDNQ